MSTANANGLLDSSYKHTYAGMLKTVASRVAHRDLTAFWPFVGEGYRAGEDWLFVGQAVNGWGRRGDQRPRFGRGKAPQVDSIRKYQDDREVGYVEGFARSPFWSPIRWLVEDDNWEGGWSGRVAWSNLFKVAPWDGGNPDSVLREAQFEGARALLHEEVRCLRPACVVVLAGIDWFEGFVEMTPEEHRRLTADVKKPRIGVGRIGNTPAILSPHPGSAYRRGWKVESLGSALFKAIQHVTN
jgi:hypothetical protein